MYPETRVSLPIKTVSHPNSLKTKPAAQPILRQASGVILVSTAPLMPSVPNLRFMIKRFYTSLAGPLIVGSLDLVFLDESLSSQSEG